MITLETFELTKTKSKNKFILASCFETRTSPMDVKRQHATKRVCYQGTRFGQILRTVFFVFSIFNPWCLFWLFYKKNEKKLFFSFLFKTFSIFIRRNPISESVQMYFRLLSTSLHLARSLFLFSQNFLKDKFKKKSATNSSTSAHLLLEQPKRQQQSNSTWNDPEFYKITFIMFFFII